MVHGRMYGRLSIDRLSLLAAGRCMYGEDVCLYGVSVSNVAHYVREKLRFVAVRITSESDPPTCHIRVIR